MSMEIAEQAKRMVLEEVERQTAEIRANVELIAGELVISRDARRAIETELETLRTAARAVLEAHKTITTDEKGRRSVSWSNMSPQLMALGDALWKAPPSTFTAEELERLKHLGELFSAEVPK